MIVLLVGVALSTLISEDLASIGAGLLAREGRLPLTHAVVACVAGVWLGDMGLWGIGRILGDRTPRVSWLSRGLAATDLCALKAQIDRRLGIAVLVSRFVPGSRLPMYVAMGAWGRQPLAFALWSLLAVMAWTPLLVITTRYVGDAVVTSALAEIRTGVLASLVTATVLLGVTRLAGWGLARVARLYHQRLAHTTETPS